MEKEKNNKKTLRDKIAMSMPIESLPIIKDEKIISLISEKYGKQFKFKFEWNENPLVQIEWSMKYQAIIRYMYADAMLNVRDNLNHH